MSLPSSNRAWRDLTRVRPLTTETSVDEYRKLTKQEDSISEAFYVPGADEIEFEIPKLDDTGIKPVDFS